MRRCSFFNYVKFCFGTETVICMKRWINLQKLITRMKLRIIFLNNCIRHNIIPPHLKNLCSRSIVDLHHARSISKFKDICKRFITGIMKNEISDAHRTIHSTRFEMVKLAHRIAYMLPSSICDEFFGNQSRTLHFYYVSKNKRLVKKFKWLLYRQIRDTKKNKFALLNIIVRWSQTHNSHVNLRSASNIRDKKSTVTSFSFDPIPLQPSSSVFETILDPRTFKQSLTSISKIKNKWFVNFNIFTYFTRSTMSLAIRGKFLSYYK